MAILSQYMWLHSHSQNDSRNNNANDIQTTKRMKLNTLHLLETTEQELNIMSEVETTRRIFLRRSGIRAKEISNTEDLHFGTHYQRGFQLYKI